MPLLRRLQLTVRQLGLALVVAGLVGMVLSGCVRILEPRQADITYYLLDSSPALDTVSTHPAGLDVGLREPRLASYLDASRIVTRHEDNQIEFSDFHRWGENLSRAINRVVALKLKARPSIGSADFVPFARGATFDYVVQLHVLRFEGRGPEPPDPEEDGDGPVPTGYSQMVVRWVIYGPDGQTVKAQGVTRDRQGDWSVTDYQGLVSRLDASLDVVAADIASRLENLDP